jgi:hypothetical protein
MCASILADQGQHRSDIWHGSIGRWCISSFGCGGGDLFLVAHKILEESRWSELP